MQQIPIHNDAKQTMGCNSIFRCLSKVSQDLRMSDQMSIQHLNNDFWSNWRKYLKVAIDQLQIISISSQVSNYHFTGITWMVKTTYVSK